ncbi:hypothetical protein FHS90_000469 [Rufibacter quisquiliarum]|uniref:Uncharacterized protein n=1 Tax=Rufibacter quisquiliarum TaxID=1549639 RepID=A0A839GA15_9BACT|nr:hypothetical protein [Rufibacter quisquiliarum]
MVETTYWRETPVLCHGMGRVSRLAGSCKEISHLWNPPLPLPGGSCLACAGQVAGDRTSAMRVPRLSGMCNPRRLQIKRAAAGIANPRVPASGLQIWKSAMLGRAQLYVAPCERTSGMRVLLCQHPPSPPSKGEYLVCVGDKAVPGLYHSPKRLNQTNWQAAMNNQPFCP